MGFESGCARVSDIADIFVICKNPDLPSRNAQRKCRESRIKVVHAGNYTKR
jgi:hypothetical protein